MPKYYDLLLEAREKYKQGEFTKDGKKIIGQIRWNFKYNFITCDSCMLYDADKDIWPREI